MTAEQTIHKILFDKGILMSLYIGRWAALRKLRPDDMLLEKINEEAYYLGHKKLMPKKAMEKLVTLEGKARTALAKRSLDFPVGGGRFVYYKTLDDVLKVLQDLRKQWDAEVEQLITDYPNMREEQLKTLDAQAENLAKEELKKTADPVAQKVRWQELESWLEIQRKENRELYPPIDQLKNKFPFEWRIFNVSAPTGMEQMSTLSAEQLVAAQKKLQQDMEVWVKDAATLMHKALGEAAAQAKQLLEKHGKLNPKNLKPLFEAFESFKAIDFTGESAFLKTVDEVKKKYGVEKDGQIDYELTAGAINYSDYMKAGLGELLGSMAKLAVDEVAEEAGKEAISKVGEFSRFVEV